MNYTNDQIENVAASVEAAWTKNDPLIREARCKKAADVLRDLASERQQRAVVTDEQACNACDVQDEWLRERGLRQPETREQREKSMRSAIQAAPPAAAIRPTVLGYFAADPAEGNYDAFKTLAEAIECADKYLDLAKDEAAESGWADEPPQICYGAILGKCEEVPGSRRPANEGSDFSEVVDFQLTSIPTAVGALDGPKASQHPEGWTEFKTAAAVCAVCDGPNKYDPERGVCARCQDVEESPAQGEGK